MKSLIFEARLIALGQYKNLDECLSDLHQQNAVELSGNKPFLPKAVFTCAYKDPKGEICVYVDCYYGLFYTVNN
jgi:hypothetical protein